MCELLALSSSHVARLTFSLHVLAARGGSTGVLHDGWGVAFCDDNDVALFREPAGSADSALVRLLEEHGPATRLAISHIRHATRGRVSLANTQPFCRELEGRMHAFAHNGDLPGIYRSEVLTLGPCHPVGQSDSEHAFCALMARLQEPWHGGRSPTMEERLAVVTSFAEDVRALGPANFLYSDGELLFAHGHRRLQPVSRRAEAPGLWMQRRFCEPVNRASDDGVGVSIDRVWHSGVWIASVPLNAHTWQPLSDGEMVVVREGTVVFDSSCVGSSP